MKKTGLIIKAVAIAASIYGLIVTFSDITSLTFFTNISNVFIDIALAVFLAGDYISLISGRQNIIRRNGFYIFKFMMTICITLTFLIYMFVLAPTNENGFIGSYMNNYAGSLCVHFITPILALLDFFLCDYEFRSKAYHAVFAVIPPLAYLAFVVILALNGMRWYGNMYAPYNFINFGAPTGWFGFNLSLLGPETLGIGVFYMVVALIIIFVALGLLFLKIKDLVASRHIKKHKFAILGAGHIAEKMAITFNKMPDIIPYAVASRDNEKAILFKNTFKLQKAYGSYEELLNDPEVECVYIATPHSLHYEHIKMCLEHGKHVLCEKSFTVNAGQARELCELACKKNLLLAEAIWTRYLPIRYLLDELLSKKVIGEVESLYATLSYPISDKERIKSPKLGGGALLDIGVYAVNFAVMVLGYDIEDITADCIKFPTGCDAATSMIFKYKNGKTAVLHCDTRACSDRAGAIYGSEGYILFDNINNCQQIRVYDSKHRLMKKYKAPKQITGFEYEAAACVDAIEHNEIMCKDMPHEEIIKVMSIMDRVREIIGVSI